MDHEMPLDHVTGFIVQCVMIEEGGITLWRASVICRVFQLTLSI